jgi:hypothetical protein
LLRDRGGPTTQLFDHPEWSFEPKFDGFGAAADTVRDLLISRNGNRMRVCHFNSLS